MELLHIRLTRDTSGWPPFDSEEIEADELQEEEFRLRRPPAFAKRLAAGDVVRVGRYTDSQVPWVEEIIESSEHSTVRIIVRKGIDDSIVTNLIEALQLRAWPTPLAGLFAVDIPADRDYSVIRATLLSRQAAGDIDFEEGALSARHDYRGDLPAEAAY
jgi:hypothetical protein